MLALELSLELERLDRLERDSRESARRVDPRLPRGST